MYKIYILRCNFWLSIYPHKLAFIVSNSIVNPYTSTQEEILYKNMYRIKITLYNQKLQYNHKMR